MDEQHFLDLVGATNLIPGPNSTEMAIHIGYERAGWRGLVAAGLCFILPAVLIVLAWAYVAYDNTPQGDALMVGIKPVIIAIVVQALYRLVPSALKGPLLAAVAVGQFTPGPVFTTATFVGYVLAGVPGAVVATIGIFLPSFCFVALLARIMPHLRKAAWTAAFWDGINVAALGLMAGVTWQLGRAALIDPLTIGLAGAAAFLLFRYKVNSAWLVLAGGLIGLGVAYLR